MAMKNLVGSIGEEIACDFLRQRDYRILARNVWKPWGELDIVCRSSEGLLVFVEVKTAWGSEVVYRPELNYSFAKQRKTHRAVESFIASNRDLVDQRLGFRIDLIAVQIKKQRMLDWREDCDIRHYENVFL